MPIYEFECKEGHVSERYLKATDTTRFVQCDTCDKGAQRIISRPNVRPDIPDHIDENLVDDHDTSGGYLVKGRAHKRERLKELGLHEVEPSYETKAKRSKGTLTFDQKRTG